MLWVENVSWTGSNYQLSVRDKLGKLMPMPVTALPNIVCEPADLQVRVAATTTDLDSWVPLSPEKASEIANHLGFPSTQAGQVFFKFSVSGQNFVVPAGVLMCAMFRPYPGMARHLFAPQGLENLCLPSGNEEQPKMLFFESPRGAAGIQPHNGQGILNSLSWMYCFPSARKMWSSVLIHARSGLLNLDLPRGELTFIGRGVPVGGQVLVTELTLQLLKTGEPPFVSFDNHVRTVLFQRSRDKASFRKGTGRRTTKATDLPSRDGVYALSNDEWDNLRESMCRPSTIQRQHDTRDLIDGALEKLGRGLTWANAPAPKNGAVMVKSTYRRMKEDGRWDLLMASLRQARL